LLPQKNLKKKVQIRATLLSTTPPYFASRLYGIKQNKTKQTNLTYLDAASKKFFKSSITNALISTFKVIAN